MKLTACSTQVIERREAMKLYYVHYSIYSESAIEHIMCFSSSYKKAMWKLSQSRISEIAKHFQSSSTGGEAHETNK